MGRFYVLYRLYVLDLYFPVFVYFVNLRDSEGFSRYGKSIKLDQSIYGLVNTPQKKTFLEARILWRMENRMVVVSLDGNNFSHFKDFGISSFHYILTQNDQAKIIKMKQNIVDLQTYRFSMTKAVTTCCLLGKWTASDLASMAMK